MSTWIFVRHGQSVANAEGWLSGWEDVPLTSQGIDEARLAQKELEGEVFDRVLCSDLQRARHTAALILEGHPPVPMFVLPEIRERRMGIFVGESLAKLREDGRWAQYLAPWEARPEGGESHAGALARVVACFQHWDVGGRTLVVGHGGWMRDLLLRLEGVPREEIGYRPPTKNAHPQRREILSWEGVV